MRPDELPCDVSIGLTPGCRISSSLKLRPFMGSSWTMASSIVVPNSVDERCTMTSMASALIVTVSVDEPTGSVMVWVSVWLTSSLNGGRAAFLNPSFSTVST